MFMFIRSSLLQPTLVHALLIAVVVALVVLADDTSTDTAAVTTTAVVPEAARLLLKAKNKRSKKTGGHNADPTAMMCTVDLFVGMYDYIGCQGPFRAEFQCEKKTNDNGLCTFTDRRYKEDPPIVNKEEDVDIQLYYPIVNDEEEDVDIQLFDSCYTSGTIISSGGVGDGVTTYDPVTGDCTLQFIALDVDPCDLHSNEEYGVRATINIADDVDVMELLFSRTGGASYYNEGAPRIAERIIIDDDDDKKKKSGQKKGGMNNGDGDSRALFRSRRYGTTTDLRNVHRRRTNVVTCDRLECTPSNPCRGIEIKGPIREVVCAGEKTCANSKISEVPTVNCRGSYSCEEASIIGPNDVECFGIGSCHSAKMEQVKSTIKCMNDVACAYTSITPAPDASIAVTCEYDERFGPSKNENAKVCIGFDTEVVDVGKAGKLECVTKGGIVGCFFVRLKTYPNNNCSKVTCVGGENYVEYELPDECYGGICMSEYCCDGQ